jgi:hypothetical protein
MGLAWTPMGGATLYVEAAKVLQVRRAAAGRGDGALGLGWRSQWRVPRGRGLTDRCAPQPYLSLKNPNPQLATPTPPPTRHRARARAA